MDESQISAPSVPTHREKNYAYANIAGQRFHRLTALYPLKDRDKKGSVIWHCRCDCGNEIDIAYNCLMYTPIKSCGCRKKEHNKELGSYLTHVDGTSIDMLKSGKVPTNNTTGVKGVYLIRGKYVAKIVFQKKQYFLGTFEDFRQAAAARREAEELIQRTVVDHYNSWKLRAQSDPQWARENPVQFLAEKEDNSRLSITCLPKL